jgi:hypothetical protein
MVTGYARYERRRRIPIGDKSNVICNSATINTGVHFEGNLIASNDVIIKPGEGIIILLKLKGNLFNKWQSGIRSMFLQNRARF